MGMLFFFNHHINTLVTNRTAFSVRSFFRKGDIVNGKLRFKCKNTWPKHFFSTCTLQVSEDQDLAIPIAHPSQLSLLPWSSSPFDFSAGSAGSADSSPGSTFCLLAGGCASLSSRSASCQIGCQTSSTQSACSFEAEKNTQRKQKLINCHIDTGREKASKYCEKNNANKSR